MTISKKLDGDKLIIALEGRLDTVSAPDLEKEAQKSLDGVKELIFDFEKLEYISSAGLRVLLTIQKMMSDKGTMKVTNANDIVKEVFEVTGFGDIITIEYFKRKLIVRVIDVKENVKAQDADKMYEVLEMNSSDD